MSPINTTTKTFAEQIADLVGKYKSYCTSNALFYWGDGASTGLRIEAPFLAKEFVDNVDFGHGVHPSCPSLSHALR